MPVEHDTTADVGTDPARISHRVALVACPTYDPEHLRAAVEQALGLAGSPDVAGKIVLVKPNMLGSAGIDRAVSTHPELLRAVIRAIRSRGAREVLVGDSPAFQSTDFVGQFNGLKPVAPEEGAVWTDFADGVRLDAPGGALVRSFEVAGAVLRADMVISLSRLKTHSAMYFTGATKNLFGVIPGLRKSQLHLRFPRKSEFGAMLADLAAALPPTYSIMDGIVAMEGEGPYNGTPRKLGVLLAGASVYASDWVASSMIGYNPMDIPYLKAAAASPACGFDPALVQTVGISPANVDTAGFKKIRIVPGDDLAAGEGSDGFLSRMSRTLVRNLTVPRPFIKQKECVLCGSCVRICAANAITFVRSPRGSIPGDTAANAATASGADTATGTTERCCVSIDYSLCIRCYCCHEVCPEGAIALRRRLF